MTLLKALATVGSMTFLSRILGFVRDTLIARVFGAGIYTDAFFVAFKIPNLLRRLSAEGAFSQAFVPVLAEYKNRRGHEATQMLVDHAQTKLFELGVTEQDVLERVHRGLCAPGSVVSADEARWVIRRLAELLGWPALQLV